MLKNKDVINITININIIIINIIITIIIQDGDGGDEDDPHHHPHVSPVVAKVLVLQLYEHSLDQGRPRQQGCADQTRRAGSRQAPFREV